jgi:hypothetical protein
MRSCTYESATLLFGLLCARFASSLFAICSVAVGARFEYCVVLSRTVRQSDQLVFCDGCNSFCNRAALVYSKRRQTFASAASVVADDWNIDRRRIVWIAAVSFFKAGDVGSNNCLNLTDTQGSEAKRISRTGAELSGSD